jgi:serine/threonine protein kinase
MSTVYRAEHTTLARAFAVKCLSRDLVSHAEAARRFEREAGEHHDPRE